MADYFKVSTQWLRGEEAHDHEIEIYIEKVKEVLANFEEQYGEKKDNDKEMMFLFQSSESKPKRKNKLNKYKKLLKIFNEYTDEEQDFAIITLREFQKAKKKQTRL